MITTVKFAKLTPEAIIPQKRTEDLGFDVYACFKEDNLVIQPNETKMVYTGIASACDTDYGFIIKERGSSGIKGLSIRAGVIDSGFRGEWIVLITNVNDKPIIITKETDVSALEEDYIVYPYTKAICQAIVIPSPLIDVEEYTYEELLAIGSERSNGKLGSSGK